jgi:uncharacterized membrane protein
MSRGKGRPDDPTPSFWSTLGPVEQAKEWEHFKPEAFEEVLKIAIDQAKFKRSLEERTAKHEFIMDYVAVAIQLLALIFGLTAVVVMALIAKYYVDHHAANAGARIFSIGTASIVAAFLGVNAAPVLRRVHSKWSRSKGSAQSFGP